MSDQIDLVIAVPSRGTVRIEWAAMLCSLAMPMNVSRMLQMIPDRDVVEARNVAVQKAREVGAHYLFFLDDDVLLPNQALRRMMQKMEMEPEWDLLSGIVPIKTDPPEPAIFRGHRPGAYWGWTFGEFFEIDACGMACCMIRMSAFDKIEGDPFEWVHTTDGIDRGETGEDIGFCIKLQKAGGRLLADGALLCGHIDTAGTIYKLDIDTAPFRRAGNKTLRKYSIIDSEKAAA